MIQRVHLVGGILNGQRITASIQLDDYEGDCYADYFPHIKDPDILYRIAEAILLNKFSYDDLIRYKLLLPEEIAEISLGNKFEYFEKDGLLL